MLDWKLESTKSHRYKQLRSNYTSVLSLTEYKNILEIIYCSELYKMIGDINGKSSEDLKFLRSAQTIKFINNLTLNIDQKKALEEAVS